MNEATPTPITPRPATMDDIADFVMKLVEEKVQEEFGVHVELGKFSLRTPNHAFGYGEIGYRHRLTFRKWIKEQEAKKQPGVNP